MGEFTGAHADDGAAGAVAVRRMVPERVERPAEQAVHARHGREAAEGREGVLGSRAVGGEAEGGQAEVGGRAAHVHEVAERVAEQRVHHVVHVTHSAHVGPKYAEMAKL